MEGLGWSFPDTRLTCQVRIVMGSEVVGWWPVGLYCQPQSQPLFSRLWILEFGLGFGTGLGLDNLFTIFIASTNEVL